MFIPFTIIGLIGGCDSAPGPVAPSTARRLEILAAAYPIADLARQIGGDRAEVTWLAEGATHPELLQGDRELIRRANNTELVITSGPWDVWAVQEVSLEARVLHLIQPQMMPSAPGHDGRAYLWLDPQVATELIEPIRHRLAVYDSASESDFSARAAGLTREIQALHRDFERALNPHRGEKLLAVRPVWSAMLGRYGVGLVAPIERQEEKLSDADLKQLARTAKELKTSALLVDAGTPIAVRQRIADRTGLRLILLDGLGTSAPAGRSTYVRLMRYNLEEIGKCWDQR